MANRINIIIAAKSMLSQALGKAKGQLKELGKAALRAAKVASAAFAGMVAGMVAAAYKAQEFNKALGQIRTLGSISMSELRKEVMAVSAEFGLAKQEITKGIYDALSAGIPKNNVFEFIRIAAKGAVAGAGTVAESVDLLTTVLNSFGIDAKDAEKVSDTLFTTVRLGKTTLSELASSLSSVAGLASASGISLEEVAAAMATLTKQGAPTNEAATRLRAAIIGLNKNLGDGWTKTMTLQDGMQRLAEAAGGSQTKLKELTGRVEGTLAVLAMTGEKAQMAADDLREMTRAAGATNAAFDQMKNLNEVDKILQSLNNIMLTLGNSTLKGLSREIKDILQAAQELQKSGRLETWGEDAAAAIKTLANVVNRAYDQLKLLSSFVVAIEEQDPFSWKNAAKSVIPIYGQIRAWKNLNKAIERAGELQSDVEAQSALRSLNKMLDAKRPQPESQPSAGAQQRAELDAESKPFEDEFNRQMRLREAEKAAAKERQQALFDELSDKWDMIQYEKRQNKLLEERNALIAKGTAEQKKYTQEIAAIDNQIEAAQKAINNVMFENLEPTTTQQMAAFQERKKEREKALEEDDKKRKRIQMLAEREAKGQRLTKRGQEELNAARDFLRRRQAAKAAAQAIKDAEAKRDRLQQQMENHLRIIKDDLRANLQAAAA